jgi:hypothetical protein
MTKRDIIFAVAILAAGTIIAAAIYFWLPRDRKAPPPSEITTRPAVLPAVASRPAAIAPPVRKLIRVDAPGRLTWRPIRKLPGVSLGQRWPVTTGVTVRWLIPEDSKVRKYIRYERTDEDPGHQSIWYTMAPCRIVVTGDSGRTYRRTLPAKRLLQWRQKRTLWNKYQGKYVVLDPPDALEFSIDIWRPADAPEHAKLFYDADGALDPAVDKPVLIQFIVGSEFVFQWRRDVDPETGP